MVTKEWDYDVSDILENLSEEEQKKIELWVQWRMNEAIEEIESDFISMSTHPDAITEVERLRGLLERLKRKM